ncbi:unnamed protein product [Adineta steineri]|uniref:Uncharacterized protein n=1 Tax=Adineta steineri TaxID=433720 RepID=A0A816DLJ0_9BILA|nr:unnamed protein product [Adineta steineri]CAF1359238.1 unnamed protein product [Adineta steineri]CAF1547543.1 unnamed protein product [Adineta steineri]CAF1637577.1 unnamed protein product [Adineta steineri]
MATQAFITICCILAPLSAISVLLITLVNENLKKSISLVAKVLAIASVISRIIGIGLEINIVVNAIKYMDTVENMVGINNWNTSMGVSCILVIVALALNLVGAVLTLMIK